MSKTAEEVREYKREYARQWRLNHPEEAKLRSNENYKRWRQENPDKYYLIQARYYAKKAGGSFVPPTTEMLEVTN